MDPKGHKTHFSKETEFLLAFIEAHDLLRFVASKGKALDKMRHVTINQVRIFGYILRNNDTIIRLKDLAYNLDVTPAAASQVVNRMVQEGLVVRTTDKSDRRSIMITTSKKGRDLFLKIIQQDLDVLFDILNRYPESDRATFSRIMAGISEELRHRWKQILASRKQTEATEVSLDSIS
ncbi:MAG: MarR family winged helix-turn-helix transcriptional regulator [Kiritimatiellia bacterium]